MPYLYGASPTSFDAVAYGFLVNLLAPPIESPLKDHALALANLPPYWARIPTSATTRGPPHRPTSLDASHPGPPSWPRNERGRSAHGSARTEA